MNDLENVKNFINSNIKNNILLKKEKEKLNEFFTPYELIEKMISYLPKNVWKDSNLKWFEPTCGVGHFMIIIYNKLFHSLIIEFPSEEERTKHILTKMLFFNDINPENIKSVKEIF